jgi:hypothetical protein
VLLALQLVLGFQLQAVQAVASPVAMQMPMSTHMGIASGTTASHADTVVHADTMVQTVDGSNVVHAVGGDAAALVVDDDSAAQPDCPKHSMPHDCCHASACQCHCVYTPGVVDVPALSNIATSVAVPSLAATQFVAPRVDEFLRPPIA